MPIDVSRPVRAPTVLTPAAPHARRVRRLASLLGTERGTGLAIPLCTMDDTGAGPKRPVRPGRARFSVGSTVIEAARRDELVRPSRVPHKRHTVGSKVAERTNVGATGIGTLDDPELEATS